ncbi:MAG: PIN domain-containing protein [Cyanobacteria bacterium J06621_8]
MIKVFLDANILFSASNANSRIYKLLRIIQKHGECVTNSYAIEEAQRNIERKKYGSVNELELVLKSIFIDDRLSFDIPVELNLKDVPILGGAIAQKCTHLLTGDRKDFGFLYGK